MGSSPDPQRISARSGTEKSYATTYSQDCDSTHTGYSVATVLRKQLECPEQPFKVTYIFRYFSFGEKLAYACAVLLAIALGITLPAMTFIFASSSEKLIEYIANDFSDSEEFKQTIHRQSLAFLYLAIGTFTDAFLAVSLFMNLGEKAVDRIRHEYFKSILSQNIAFFDSFSTGEASLRLMTDANDLQEGMSEKLCLLIMSISSVFGGIALAFIRSWKLALMLLAVFVFIFAVFFLVAGRVRKYSIAASEYDAKADEEAQEAISSIRNVQAFGLEDSTTNFYSSMLAKFAQFSFYREAHVAAIVGTFWLGCYSIFSLGFWQGAKFVHRGELQVSNVISTVLSVSFSALAASENIGKVQNVTRALTAAKRLFATIDRKPYYGKNDDFIGHTLDNVEGSIEFKNVCFAYPSRPDVDILIDFSLKIPQNKTIAIVGESGSGKSSLFGLLERFYCPLSGEITVDGHDIRTLDLHWLREQIGYVTQDSNLFSCSIYDNIALGFKGTKAQSISQDEKLKMVTEAAEIADVLDFINSLPDGFDTEIGERGFKLSGGQKQRVSIARAIVAKPRILLLDEATSALDSHSEKKIQESLETRLAGRTIITIAHRLSTVRNADTIIVMDNGQIVESGSHDELLSLKGRYYSLLHSEQLNGSKLAECNEAVNGGSELTLSRSKMQLDEEVALSKLDKVNTSITDTLIAEGPRAYSIFQLVCKLLVLGKPEYRELIISYTFSAVAASSPILMSVFMGKLFSLFQDVNDTNILPQADIWSGLFFMLGGVAFIAYNFMYSFGAASGTKVIARLKLNCFKALISRPLSYFDIPEHSTGQMMGTLEKLEVADTLTSTVFTKLFASFLTLFSSCIMCLILAWKFAIVGVVCMPLLLLSGYGRLQIMNNVVNEYSEKHKQIAGDLCEAIDAIKTVQSLCSEVKLISDYAAVLDAQSKNTLKLSIKGGSLFSLGYSFYLLVNSLLFYWGGTLLLRKELSLFHFFTCLITLVVGTQSAGALIFANNLSAARNAANQAFDILEYKDEDEDVFSRGELLHDFKGNVEFCDVYFQYTTSKPVLKGLNLKIKAGQYAGIVGSSGCGKSTMINLIESFYTPQAGSVLLDDVPVSSLNLKEYRKKIALVQQEPIIYHGTIRDNIECGRADDGTPVSDEDLDAVCRLANIYDFIQSLPEGYDTMCGNRGALLSGGQKQRITIARALIRDPKVLLLDEATSALDNESESAVQKALDDAAIGRTTISIAHRLSTLARADVIFVLSEGIVAETGTHEELMQMNGLYAELARMQGLKD
ncbi:hypothetical protein CANCADRAFT_2792 [Tortispora caseinolytica NRRL Y-17796]|uniref:Uncharacterized protein n=1 Tax=Tortispora caseinolytica NRRL Y-17796 TaxID=767744 RepID=A0A1E4TH93_9ASCO|nr:hypothetical protein CANCADRAFT_2792 [Tortispora caseinolytica NRRL Y-17796]